MNAREIKRKLKYADPGTQFDIVVTGRDRFELKDTKPKKETPKKEETKSETPKK